MFSVIHRQNLENKKITIVDERKDQNGFKVLNLIMCLITMS